jgi:hypothetical protein
MGMRAAESYSSINLFWIDDLYVTQWPFVGHLTRKTLVGHEPDRVVGAAVGRVGQVPLRVEVLDGLRHFHAVDVEAEQP